MWTSFIIIHLMPPCIQSMPFIFFSGLSRSWWSRGAASVAHGKDKEIIKTIPFFFSSSYFCRNCIQIIPKEYPAKTHIFESPAFSFAFMHKWKVRLMPAFFEHFFKCTIFVSGNALRIVVSHTPIRLLVPGQVFFSKAGSTRYRAYLNIINIIVSWAVCVSWMPEELSEAIISSPKFFPSQQTIWDFMMEWFHFVAFSEPTRNPNRRRHCKNYCLYLMRSGA